MSLFVKDLLKSEIYTIDSNDSIINAAKTMNNLGISCLLVTCEGLAVGIITERDIMKSIMFDIPNIHERPVNNFMSTRLITIQDDATVSECVVLMTRNRIKKLPVKNSEGVIVGIISLTDIVSQQPEILLKSKELVEVNEGLDSYTDTVAHDLKAPLRHIASYGKMLKEDYSRKLDDTGVLYIDRMIRATEQMSSLIEDLLNLSKVDKIQVDESFSPLNEILDQVRSESMSLRFSQVLIDCPDYVASNTELIKQLFTNLVSNGIKFNKSNPPRVTVSSTRLENGVLFKVQDNGIGIEPIHHAKVFEMFTRLHNKEDYPGTGAGLTICKKIVDKLQGSIRFESTVGEGTTFFVELPDSVVKEGQGNNMQFQPQVVSLN